MLDHLVHVVHSVWSDPVSTAEDKYDT